MHLILDNLKKELLKVVLLRAPNEAAGVILKDGTVVELQNLSDHPEDSFLLDRAELVKLLQFENEPEEVTLWHSHPSGGVGPSRIDMQQKTPLKYHLVLSLVEGDITPTWY